MKKLNTKNKSAVRRSMASGILLAFIVNMILAPVSPALAQSAALPLPGEMVYQSPSYSPAVLRGLQYFPDDPLKFNFIIDPGDEILSEASLKTQSEQLIKYFLASLTVPDQNMWVNLSPDEKTRIIPDGFGSTQMGMTLLAQDYLLKQLSSSLINPGDKVGKRFWANIHQELVEKYGTIDIAVNTFNRVWIVPDVARIYRQDDKVFVGQTHLKVMLDKDYRRYQNQSKDAQSFVAEDSPENIIARNATEEILIPALEREVNEGKNFAQLRQVYHSLILAVWFKKNLRESFLGKNYAQQDKVTGVEVDDLSLKERIYDDYVQSFEKGIYNIIKEDIDPLTQEMIPKKYFSGGITVTNLQTQLTVAGSAVEVESVQKGKAYQVLTYLGLNRGGKNRGFVAALSTSLLFHLSVMAWWGPQGSETRPIEAAPRLEAVLVGFPDLKKSVEQQAKNSEEQQEVKPLIMRIDGKPLGEGFLDPNDSLSSNLTTEFINPQEGGDPRNPFGLSKEQLKAANHYLLGANGEVVEVLPGQLLSRAMQEVEEERATFRTMTIEEPPPVTYSFAQDSFAPSIAAQPQVEIAFGQDFGMQAVKGLPGTWEVAIANISKMGEMLNRFGVWKEHPGYQGQVVSSQKVDELLTSTGDIDSDRFGKKKDSLFTAYNATANELARFFNQAGNRLTPQEKKFKDFLEKKQVIKNQGGKFVGDKDVNILVHSNDLEQADEHTVREHEKGHALYEHDKQYQQEVLKVKKKLTEEEQQFLKKLLTHMGYHEVSHDREFAEYFTDRDLLLHHLRRIFSDRYDRNQLPEVRTRARELSTDIFREGPSGQFFTDFMKKFLKSTMPDLVKVKSDAQKRASIADAEVKSADMSWLNSNIVPNKETGGPAIGMSVTEAPSFTGSQKEIMAGLKDPSKNISADDQKKAADVLSGFIGKKYNPNDVFVLSYEDFDKSWDVDLVRKEGETPLQEVVDRRLAQVPTSEKNNAQSILKAVGEVLAQKSYALGESLAVQVPVNVQGEAFDMVIQAFGGHDRAWSGREKIKDEAHKTVVFRIDKNGRPNGWRGNLYARQSGTDFSKVFDEALIELNKNARSQGFGGIVPLGESTKVLTLDEIQTKRLNLIEPAYENQRINFLIQINISGKLFDLHVTQSQERGRYETRLAVEIPGKEFEYAQTVGNLGVRHEEAETSRKGFEEAMKLLKPKVEDWLKDQKQNSQLPKAASSSLDVEPPGGIDLNPQNWQLEEQTDRPASSVILFDPETSTVIPFSGITPIIIQTTPVSLPLLLGLSVKQSQNFALAEVY
ncbi:MAG: hypothetical protein H6753_00225 [Candidatus Omnitrophica bacterium]|nr:hypothetical protein [Candidatus Omnitrophota bacterium]